MDAETHIMLDLETLGNAPGCVIVSIGAVCFKLGKNGLHELVSEFEACPSLKSCEKAGLRMEGSTVLWWLEQSKEAQAELLKGQQEPCPLCMALDSFAIWIRSCCPPAGARVCLWGNGASFDCAVLAAAYRACDKELPWRYSGERCYRTMKAMYPEVVEEPREGVHHRAMDDARHQAKHLMKILDHLRALRAG